jgi:hypothetical protein
VAMDCLRQIMLNQKLACEFKKWCKFSSCAKAKSYEKKSLETWPACIAQLQYYFSLYKMYCICIIQRSDATENVMTLSQLSALLSFQFQKFVKAKLLVSLSLGKLKCMEGGGLCGMEGGGLCGMMFIQNFT